MAAGHALDPGLVALGRSSNLLVSFNLCHALIVLLVEGRRASVHLGVSLLLEDALALDLDLESFLVGFQLHHALQFEGVSVVRHDFY